MMGASTVTPGSRPSSSRTNPASRSRAPTHAGTSSVGACRCAGGGTSCLSGGRGGGAAQPMPSAYLNKETELRLC